jgi:hypothetical protein
MPRVIAEVVEIVEVIEVVGGGFATVVSGLRMGTETTLREPLSALMRCAMTKPA